MTRGDTAPRFRLRAALARLARACLCRIFGHFWRFEHAHAEAGQVHRCARCGISARFVR